MKYILAFLLIFTSLFVKAQDTAFTYTPPDALSLWRMSLTLPIGVEADTIRARYKGGVYWVRVIDDGVYTLAMGGVKSDGTNQTTAIVRLLSKPYVREIKVASDSSRKYTFNTNFTIPTGKVITFENGCSWGGTATITGGVINANERASLFDSTLTVNPEASTTGRFSLQWWVTQDTARDCGPQVRKVTAFIRNRGGGNLYAPARVYKVTRGGSPAQLFLLDSYMNLFGDGMGQTILKLNPLDLLNFRRMVTFNTGSHDVVKASVHDLSIDMSNVITSYNYRGSQGWVGDAQNAGIFAYSDNFRTRNCQFYNLEIYNVTGDIIVLSKNSKDITVDNVHQHDYLRQGIGLGGDGGSDGLTVSRIYDEINTIIPKDSVGGNSIHTEPADVLTNVKYLNCNVNNFSASGIRGGLLDGVTTKDSINCVANFVSDFTITNCNIPNAVLSVSPFGVGNVKVINNIRLKKLQIVRVAGNTTSPTNITVANNSFTNSKDYCLEVNNMSGVIVSTNYATTDSSEVFYFVNSVKHKVFNNTVNITTGTTSNIGIYAVITSGSFGSGMSEFYNNSITSPGVGLRIGAQSAIVGRNIIDAPTRIFVTGAFAKIFPFTEADGRKILYDGSGLPQYGIWQVKDEIITSNTAVGGVVKYICSTAGGLNQGAWSSGGSYGVNSYVLGSNGRTYYAKTIGGQAEDPVTDSDSTYWVQGSTGPAVFQQVGIIGQEYYGAGNPNGIQAATPGAIWHNSTPLSKYSVIFLKVTGTSSTGWDTLTVSGTITGADTVAFVGTLAQLRLNSSAKYTMALTTGASGGVWYKDIADVSSTDNTGTIVVDAGGRRWKRSYQGAIYGDWFGIVYDGVTDNRTTLQNLINSMNAKDILTLSKGIIGISGKIDFSKLGITIQGAGSASSTIIKRLNGGSIPNIFSYYNTTQSTVNLDSSITIRNLTLDGNRANNTTVDTGIVFRNLSANGDVGLIMDNVNIINTTGPGCFTSGRLGITKFLNVEFLDNKIGFYTFGSDGVYYNVNSGRADTIGFYIRGSNNRFTACKSWGVLPASNGYGVVIDGSRNIIQGFEIQDIRSKSLVLRGAVNLLNGINIDRLIDSTNSVAIELNTTDSYLDATVSNYVKFTNGGVTTNAYLVNKVLSKRNIINIRSTNVGARTMFLNGFVTPTDSSTFATIHHGSLGDYYFPPTTDSIFVINAAANDANYDSLLYVQLDSLKARGIRVAGGSNIEVVRAGDQTKFSYTINSTYTKGRTLFNGTGAQTTFTVTHTLGQTPTSVTASSGSSAANLVFYVTNFTSTTFDIVFATAPASGTNNVAINWQANK